MSSFAAIAIATAAGMSLQLATCLLQLSIGNLVVVQTLTVIDANPADQSAELTQKLPKMHCENKEYEEICEVLPIN
ncbi:MAG: hypothetical protein GC179_09640 [Anaerolineaceae bacterium]|nr:hypothetical protein [Anaerolineaceae bacterium]